ncbi:hypothetical protein QBC40DRAFT_342360 [Triangularia verruculosa]|uniref:Zn(2)-C6 fungal-type domain-containing protein n=1 Tax=Triangularia verruculosa TaxID=2587418 RepID=A0AAN7ARZ9_9PEZI|nr:hypothetical protein QBC40DRAFT_342360 [Triangularia verruculosa]
MLRRSHKKSRAGCLECKRRHVKCDEQRPKCIICTLSERDCSYASPTQPSQATSMADNEAASSIGDRVGISPPGSVSGSASSIPGDAAPVPGVPLPELGHPSSYLSTDVNTAHMELIIRFKFSDHAPEMNEELHDFSSKLLFRCALQAPYLMHQMLAVCARRLAVLFPERSSFFFEHAMHLQTRAISIYNETAAKVQIDQNNCSALLLYCSLLSRHLLADLLAKRDTNFDGFLDRYLQFLSISGGLKGVSVSAWDLLLESDIRHLVLWAIGISQSPPLGNHCDYLRHLISEASSLDLVSKDACRKAVDYLQVGFDRILGNDVRNERYLMIFMPAAVPSEFTDLLVQRRQEAIAVMGHWALYLHLSREVWHVADSGAHLLKSIATYLGPDWGHWLSWPLSVLAQN